MLNLEDRSSLDFPTHIRTKSLFLWKCILDIYIATSNCVYLEIAAKPDKLLHFVQMVSNYVVSFWW